MVGQHFFVGIPGHSIDSNTRKVLKEVHPGGIILFGRNVRDARQLAKLTADLRSLLGRDLMICIDHEGGRVNRLKELVGVVPSAQQLGHLGMEKFARKHGELTGRLLSEFGINLNLAPVLDLHLRPKTDNSVPDRCWSRNPEEVICLAGAFVHGMQSEGVIACGKHFLSYGAADKDPHLVLPRVTRTRKEILTEDLRPYAGLTLERKGKHPKLHMIMLSHAHLEAFHGKKPLIPACISRLISQDLLRDQMGFNGVAITDDLEMGAITKQMTIGQASVRCLQASADFILICHTAKAIREGFRASEKAVKNGELPRDLMASSRKRLDHVIKLPPPPRKFSPRRFEALQKEIQIFTRLIFAKLPEPLRKIDERWGAIGEKY
jgi:beta-N-acetylhexosaminidase